MSALSHGDLKQGDRVVFTADGEAVEVGATGTVDKVFFTGWVDVVFDAAEVTGAKKTVNIGLLGKLP